MDSMLGYKNDKYLYFGRIPAKLDDVFNYIPCACYSPVYDRGVISLRSGREKCVADLPKRPPETRKPECSADRSGLRRVRSG